MFIEFLFPRRVLFITLVSSVRSSRLLKNYFCNVIRYSSNISSVLFLSHCFILYSGCNFVVNNNSCVIEVTFEIKVIVLACFI